MTAKDLIRRFEMLPPPEGGFFKETYRADGKMMTPSGERNYATCIYFLLQSHQKSKLHRIRSDEIWHFYLGGPLEIVEIDASGQVAKTILGPELGSGQKLQHVVKAGVWFGAAPLIGTNYSFVGCSVSPGFAFEDFELAKREELLVKYPNAAQFIKMLT